MTTPDKSDAELLPGTAAWVEKSATDETSNETGREQLRLRKRHWWMLRIAVLIVILACLLQVRPDQRVEFRFGPSMPLPETCGSRILFGVECPGCGLTRSFILLTRGDIWAAWHLNRVSWLLAIAVLIQIPYRLWSLRQLDRRVTPSLTYPVWFGRLLIFLLIGNWVLKALGI